MYTKTAISELKMLLYAIKQTPQVSTRETRGDQYTYSKVGRDTKANEIWPSPGANASRISRMPDGTRHDTELTSGGSNQPNATLLRTEERRDEDDGEEQDEHILCRRQRPAKQIQSTAAAPQRRDQTTRLN